MSRSIFPIINLSSGLLSSFFLTKLLKTFSIFNDSEYDHFLDVLSVSFSFTVMELDTIACQIYDDLLLSLETTKGVGMLGIPTYVSSLPTGDEKGNYLTLDIGGSKIRLSLIELFGNQENPRIVQETKPIPKIIKEGSGRKFIKFIVDFISVFLDTQKPEITKNKLEMGFTFSFPVRQTGIREGYVLGFTKEFNCSDIIGKNVVSLLQKEINSRNIPVEIVSILNDTTSTLLAGRYFDPETEIGVVCGTGINVSYIEKASKVTKLSTKNKGQMIINTELGNFHQDSYINKITTIYDNIIDTQSADQGLYTFEKTISGHYMGEIIRVILLDAITRIGLFSGRTGSLDRAYSLSSINASDIESDKSIGLNEIDLLISTVFNISSSTYRDRRFLQEVCKLVSSRSASLVAAAVAAIVRKIPHTKSITISACGSCIKNYHNYIDRFKICLASLLDSGTVVRVIFPDEPSTIGCVFAKG